MDKIKKLEKVRRKTRQRLLFALVTLVLYFSYVFNYTAGSPLGEKIGGSQVTGSLVMFACLIFAFIGLEVLFLALNRSDRED